MAKKKAADNATLPLTDEFLRSVGGKLMKHGRGGVEHWNFGWIPPERRTVDENEAAEAAVKEMPKFSIKGKSHYDNGKEDEPDKVVLFELWKHPLIVAANGWEFTGIWQKTGSCVGAGGGNCWMTLACVDTIIRGEAENPLLPFWLLPYGRSRYYLGDRGPGEGSTGSTFAKAAREDGVVPAVSEGLPPFTRTGGFVWGSKEEYKWSDGDNPDTMRLLPASRLHLVKTTARCKDHNDVREAIVNGYPCTAASNYAHDGGTVVSDPPVSIGKKRGSWSHQMHFGAWWKHPKEGELFWLENQWGHRAHTMDPTRGTGSGVWIRPADVDWICRDEVFAFSQYNGFPSQTFIWG